jgi:hypothetical protein
MFLISRSKGRLMVAAVLLALLWAIPSWAGDETLDELLEQVGQSYAEGYLAPLIHGFGINTNTALFHTAKIPKTRLTFNVGIKAMATSLNDADKTFRIVENVALDDFGYPGETGKLVFEGPTVFGAEDESGRVTAYWNGLPVYQIDGITSLVDLDYVLLATPEVSVGGIAGLQATLRWLPTMTMGDLGDLGYFGFGAAYGVSHLMPTLPVDVSVGFFYQNLDVGESLQTSATSFYGAVSKGFALVTVYAGAAKESSSMDVTYTYQGEDGSTPSDISFSIDGVQTARGTLGATLNLGVKLNAEVGFGKLTTYSAGLLFGF